VLATLHTTDATRTVSRVLALMRGDVGENRYRLAGVLEGVVAQRLVPRIDGEGLVLAVEVLVGSRLVRESIRRPEGNPSLRSLMEKGTHPYGMQTFQMSLAYLVSRGMVDDAAAAEAAD
jgi:twitching motility protein PilT